MAPMERDAEGYTEQDRMAYEIQKRISDLGAWLDDNSCLLSIHAEADKHFSGAFAVMSLIVTAKGCFHQGKWTRCRNT
jgi:hypothetical protein